MLQSKVQKWLFDEYSTCTRENNWIRHNLSFPNIIYHAFGYQNMSAIIIVAILPYTHWINVAENEMLFQIIRAPFTNTIEI